MDDRLAKEFELLQQVYGATEAAADRSWVVIESFPLPTGWSRESTPLLILVPAGYPLTAPDNFYTADDLKLASGIEPGSSSPGQSHVGRTWKMFSWHVDGSWSAGADEKRGDNLLTFLLKCRDRLEDRT